MASMVAAEYTCFNGHKYWHTCYPDPELGIAEFPRCPECDELVQLIVIPKE